MSSWRTGIWWKPRKRSIFEKTVQPAREALKSWMWSSVVTVLSRLKSLDGRQPGADWDEVSTPCA